MNPACLQPFVTYATRTETTLSPNSESTCEWSSRQRTVPITFGVARVLHFAGQWVQVGAVARCPTADSDRGPHGWGWRPNLALLVPR